MPGRRGYPDVGQPNGWGRIMTPEFDALLEDFGAFVEETVGLSCPLARRNDLMRAVVDMAQQERFERAEDCMRAMMTSAGNQLTAQTLGRYLSTGETYFFRDAGTFSVLKSEIFPRLIAARRESGRKTLRILSAGCCSGEEAYSLSILAHELLGMERWDLRVAGIDINPAFLQSARTGVYGEWSFRGVPAYLKLRHFEHRGDGSYAVTAEGRRDVDFRFMNLAVDDYGALDDLAPFDLVLCQNVLMYFGAEPWRHVAAKIHGLLDEDGWLCVGPVESDRSLYPEYRPVELGGLTFYSKGEAPVPGPALPYSA